MVNSVTLIGHLGQDPEVVTFKNGDQIAKLSLATTESYKNKEGEKVQNTEWHTVIISGNSVAVAEKYLAKGQMICVEGKIQYKSYEKDGITKYFTEIRAKGMTMLGGKKEEAKPATKERPNFVDQDSPFDS